MGEELWTYGVFVDTVITCYDSEPRRSHEVVAFIFGRVVADDGSVRDVDIAVHDGVSDAAVAADVDVGKDDAGVHELSAMPGRPGSPKTNLAGGYW